MLNIPTRPTTNPVEILPLLVKLADGFAVLFAGALAFLFRFGVDAFPIPSAYTLLALASAFILVGALSALGAYRSWRGGNLIVMTGQVLAGWAITIINLLVLLFAVKASGEFSRLWLITWAATAGGLLVMQRMAIAALLRWLRAHGRNHKRVILVGHSDMTRELIRRLKTANWTGFDLVAILDDQAAQSAVVGGVPLQRGLANIEAFVKDKHVSEVWITLPLREEARVRHVLHLLRHSMLNIRYVPDIFAFRLLNHGVSEIAGIPMLDLSTTPMTGINRLVKALEDHVLALLILITISPLLLGIALAVRLSSPGPILFKQKRHGWDGREINVYKFRSMYVHREDGERITQARASDTRITPLGAFLRRTSLDELPQFFNVLQGRMSIVGPRPHALAHNEHYKELIESYMLRHKVKPGITGWAQVNGYRGETDTLEKMQKRIDYDLYYIEHWSLALDLKIILLTLFKGFKHPNAY